MALPHPPEPRPATSHAAKRHHQTPTNRQAPHRDAFPHPASDRPAPCLLASPLPHRRHPDDFAGGNSSGATLHILQPAPLRRRCFDLAFRRPTHRSHHRNPLTSPGKAKIRPHQANRFSNHERELCMKSDVSSRWRGLGWRSRRRVGAGLTPRQCPKIERAQ